MREEPSHDEPVAEAAPTDLLSSPIERTLVNRIFVIGGPLGLLVAIVLSLWVSYMRVDASVIVQVDQQWLVGEQLAIRGQMVDGRLSGIDDTRVQLAVRQGDRKHDLGVLEAAPKGGLAQGRITVPELDDGAAELELRFLAPGREAITETVSVTVARERRVREGTHTVSASTLQWGDDTDPHPPSMRIDLRPAGRLLAGFTNRLLVRITEKSGHPWSGPVEVALLDGEFMGKRGADSDPPRLVTSSTNALGLLPLEGPVTSEVLRVEVRVLSTEEPTHLVHSRKFRMVSYAGAVAVDVDRLGTTADGTIEIRARGLSGKRPVFVDMYDGRGAWIDTLMPPVVGAEPPREWAHTGLHPGILQFEAYHYTNTPGESTAIARLQVTDGEPTDPKTLEPLIARQRARLDLPRIEKDFDKSIEGAYLDAIAKAEVAAQDVKLAREWLIGTLPVEVFGPPTALVTRSREDSQVAARKELWTLGVRWFLLGGGGLFIAAMTLLMLNSHAAAARRTLAGLHSVTEDDERGQMDKHVRDALRGALFRGFGVIGVMIAALILTVMLLENLLWEF